jgi:membrane-associated phospholipid phosphatase
VRTGGRDLAAVAGFALVTVALASGAVRAFDLWVRDVADNHRPEFAYWAARGLNYLGSGGALTVLCGLIAIGLALRRRTVWPVGLVVLTFVATGVVIQPLKSLFHRAAPHSPLPDEAEVRLFSQADGLSFPSGHAVNTIVWYGVLTLLLAPWLSATAVRWLRFTPPAVIAVVSPYLGFHWVTDVLAGFCLGVLIDRQVVRIERWVTRAGPAPRPPRTD